jgi:hypothetical protein
MQLQQMLWILSEDATASDVVDAADATAADAADAATSSSTFISQINFSFLLSTFSFLCEQVIKTRNVNKQSHIRRQTGDSGIPSLFLHTVHSVHMAFSVQKIKQFGHSPPLHPF